MVRVNYPNRRGVRIMAKKKLDKKNYSVTFEVVSTFVIDVEAESEQEAEDQVGEEWNEDACDLEQNAIIDGSEIQNIAAREL